MKMLKRNLALVLAVIFAFGAFGVLSFAAEEQLTFKIRDDGYAEVYSCAKSAKGIVEVPSAVYLNGALYDVKSIGYMAFSECDSITEIIIPEGVKTIGAKAFYGCDSLTDVYIPESLISCQYDAFESCNKLTVHCFMSNYNFFAIYGTSDNIVLDIVDANGDTDSGEDEDMSMDLGIIGKIIDLIRKLVYDILELFGVDG